MTAIALVLQDAAEGFFVTDPTGLVRWSNESFNELAGNETPDPYMLMRALTPADRHRVWQLGRGAVRNTSGGLSVTATFGSRGEANLHLGAIGRPVEALLGRVQHLDHAVAARGRLGELEQTLRRIAEDLQGLGLTIEFDGTEHRSPLPDRLPERQRQILNLELSGLDITDIADALSLSPHTVRNHKKAAFRSLGIHSRLELFARYRSGDETKEMPRPMRRL